MTWMNKTLSQAFQTMSDERSWSMSKVTGPYFYSCWSNTNSQAMMCLINTNRWQSWHHGAYYGFGDCADLHSTGCPGAVLQRSLDSVIWWNHKYGQLHYNFHYWGAWLWFYTIAPSNLCLPFSQIVLWECVCVCVIECVCNTKEVCGNTKMLVLISP